MNKKHLGLILCVVSLLLFCLVKLPYNLSVIGAGENEGFSFVYGQNFLLRHEFAPGRGPLFILVYALILKIFGFNTWSIIACHYVQTLVVLLIGIIIYLIIKRVLRNSFYGGLAVLFWILFIITPIGKAGKFEIVAHYSLEAEYFSVLFSLLSILFLTVGKFFDDNPSVVRLKENIFLFLSGIFAVSSMLFKTSGAVLLVALFFLSLLLVIFDKKFFNLRKSSIYYCLLGVVFSLMFCNVLLSMKHNNLFEFWRDYVLIGSYNHDYLISFNAFISSLFNFMTRHTSSINNFILFLVALVLYVWSVLRIFIVKNYLSRFCVLVGIWGLGNICAIIAPGMYQPYYYDLIWPSVAIVFVLGLSDLRSYLEKLNMKFASYSLTLLFVVFFIYKIILMFPYHINLASGLNRQSFFNQPESFQDPVLAISTDKDTRSPVLKVGDFINSLLPDKKSTVYTFNFDKKAYMYFNSLIYLYAKRYPPTSISSGLLCYECILEKKLEILQRDLISMPPNILIVSRENNMLPLIDKRIGLFLKWFNDFINQEYRFKSTINYGFNSQSSTAGLNIYEKI